MISWKLDGLFKADAEKVAEEIKKIKDATPDNILEFARDENSELHKCFEWDDSIAAEKWRKQQARQIVCNLVYEEPQKQEEHKIRVFYSTDNTKYQPTTLIMEDKTEYEKLLDKAYSELRSFKEKYKMLHELDEIFSLIV